MRFIFEEKQPILQFAININGDVRCAGIDFVRNVQIRKNTLLYKVFCGNRGDIHQANWLLNVKVIAQRNVRGIGGLNGGVVDANVGKLRFKGSMPAVIRPVRVNYFKLGNGRIALFTREICLRARKIGVIDT